MSDAALLRLERLSVAYGRVEALSEVSLHLDEGECVAVLGANGAGKTTLLRAISGILAATQGRIAFDGAEIQNLPPETIVRRRLIHSPQGACGREIFPLMTVRDNLRLGAYTRNIGRDEMSHDIDAVLRYFPILRERLLQPAGRLSGGEQQMLAMGRGLMARPRLWLLDEPSLGLSPKRVRELFEIVMRVRSEHGVSVLLVEQNARLALKHSDRAYVLSAGRVATTDFSARLRERADIHKLYFGEW
ncbi:MAG TPA: ABC transporter ATP-binding protein [Rhodocyclaceae bacterium]|nr:ABC transporter ATP-binding protein [Rhodocyclaceae bacterium]